MKLLLIVLLGILAMNLLVIVAVAGILIIDHRKARRRERALREEDAHAKAS
jgi:hypothetical protein